MSKEPPRGLSTAVRPDRARAVALEVLADVLEEGQLADRVLARVLRRERGLLSAERRWVSETVYGLLRREGALRSALQRALGDTLLSTFSAPDVRTALLLGHLSIAGAGAGEGEGKVPATAGSGALPPKLRSALTQLASQLTADLQDASLAGADTALALRHSLPTWLATRLVAEIGEVETEALFAALNLRAPLTLRANLLVATRATLIDSLRAAGAACQPTPLSPWGVTLAQHVNAFALPSFKAGAFEIQDEGSQLLALLCRARPGQRVVDACAGGGGKTLALASEMHNRGELWALDSSARRLAELKPRARRAGVHNVRSVVLEPTGALPPALDGLRGKAEVVLVDAPCSGTGALRRNPDSRRRLTEAWILEHAAIQRAVLTRMAPLVAPGGLLVYATCSLLRAENEEIVSAFLADPAAAGGQFAPVPPSELLGAGLAKQIEDQVPARLRSPSALRLWPQHHGTDGFFGAALRRRR